MRSFLIHTGVLWILLLSAALAFGQDVGVVAGNPEGEEVLSQSLLGTAVSEESLGTSEGRQGIQIEQLNMQLNNLKNTGVLTENVLNSAATGTNALSGDAFSNMNGIATVIQNSGNQVIIQNSLIFNLTLK